MSKPTLTLFARETRRLAEQHEWDTMPAFTSLHWDGETLANKTLWAIDPTIHPDEYPGLIIGAARRILYGDRDNPPCAYTFQAEAHVVLEPGPEASGAERAAYDTDRLNRTFHERADAVEKAGVWCADIHGRMWMAEKTRGQDGITEHYWPAGSKGLPGGPVTATLWAAGVATGVFAYGLVKVRGVPFDIGAWLAGYGFVTPASP